jgi:hypothetical protein
MSLHEYPHPNQGGNKYAAFRANSFLLHILVEAKSCQGTKGSAAVTLAIADPTRSAGLNFFVLSDLEPQRSPGEAVDSTRPHA